MSFQTARNYELGLLILNTYLYSLGQGKLKQGMSDDDVVVRPWLPLKKIGDLFVLNNYIDKLYSKLNALNLFITTNLPSPPAFLM